MSANRMFITGIAALGALGMLSLAALPSSAQLGLGDPRKIYPGAEQAVRPGPPPNPNFTHGVRVLPGGGYYGGGNIIIVNGGPCYTPGYYGGFGGYYGGYNTGGFSMGFNVGGLSMGYQQSNGYTTFNQVPPAVPYGYNQPYNYPTSGQQYAQVRSSRQTPPALKTGEDDANDYYLNRKTSPLQKEPGLSQAVRDIETAFRNGDIRLLEKHVDVNGSLTLMSMGRTRRQLAAASYIEMTKDAFASIKTASYTLDKVEPASGGAYLVYGKHVLRGDNGTQTFNVSFVLKKTADQNGSERWLITEVSADPAK